MSKEYTHIIAGRKTHTDTHYWKGRSSVERGDLQKRRKTNVTQRSNSPPTAQEAVTERADRLWHVPLPLMPPDVETKEGREVLNCLT